MNVLILCSFSILFSSIFLCYAYTPSGSPSIYLIPHVTFSFSYVTNLFFRLLTSKFKFPIFRLTIAMVLNNSIVLLTCITFAAISSTDFSVFVCVVGFLDPFVNDPISCTNLFPNPNSNGCPSTNPGLLISTCSSSGLNTTKEGYVSTIFVYILVTYRPYCVCCCCYK